MDVAVTTHHSGHMLDAEDLSPADEGLLSMLEEGRITAPMAADELDYSLQHMRDRLGRLVEHGNARKVHEGVYELVADPRGAADSEMLDRVRAIEWESQGGARTAARERGLAGAAEEVRRRGEVDPTVLRRWLMRNHDVDLEETSARRMISENLQKIDGIVKVADGQIYAWDGEE